VINDFIELAIYQNPAMGTYDLYLRMLDGVKTMARPAQIIFEDTEPGVWHEPCLSFSPEAAQRLMNQLWQSGLRPNNGEGSVANVEALKQHLNDMRAIVASRLEVKL
jgi:hypothetical protein